MVAFQFEFPERAVVPLPERNKPPEPLASINGSWSSREHILFVTRIQSHGYGNYRGTPEYGSKPRAALSRLKPQVPLLRFSQGQIRRVTYAYKQLLGSLQALLALLPGHLLSRAVVRNPAGGRLFVHKVELQNADANRWPFHHARAWRIHGQTRHSR
jgi:hypothetical protein